MRFCRNFAFSAKLQIIFLLLMVFLFNKSLKYVKLFANQKFCCTFAVYY